nr:uncharacterized protein LOC127347946 [Lolium perenne]
MVVVQFHITVHAAARFSFRAAARGDSRKKITRPLNSGHVPYLLSGPNYFPTAHYLVYRRATPSSSAGRWADVEASAGPPLKCRGGGASRSAAAEAAEAPVAQQLQGGRSGACVGKAAAGEQASGEAAAVEHASREPASGEQASGEAAAVEHASWEPASVEHASGEAVVSPSTSRGTLGEATAGEHASREGDHRRRAHRDMRARLSPTSADICVRGRGVHCLSLSGCTQLRTRQLPALRSKDERAIRLHVKFKRIHPYFPMRVQDTVQPMVIG